VKTFYESLVKLLESHTALVVATIVKVSGSSPRDAGTKMVVFQDGSFEGTVGGGSLEARVVQDALGCLKRRAPAVKAYSLSDSSLGMKCGGSVDIFLEPVFPADRLVIFGGGHVGKAIARLAPSAGFTVEVVDDRPEHLEAAAFPAGTELIQTDAAFTGGFSPVGEGDFVAVVTRQHDTDADLAGRYAGKCLYLGVMGSKTKAAFIKKRLQARGISARSLRHIRCPMGLDIGADSPEEVAISAVAEMVSVRAERRGPKGDR
jgi:xanthine dehydrogenase accessory factor